jgi:hypothetical protein
MTFQQAELRNFDFLANQFHMNSTDYKKVKVKGKVVPVL